MDNYNKVVTRGLGYEVLAIIILSKYHLIKKNLIVEEFFDFFCPANPADTEY